jgi:hypothetical protein
MEPMEQQSRQTKAMAEESLPKKAVLQHLKKGVLSHPKGF